LFSKRTKRKPGLFKGAVDNASSGRGWSRGCRLACPKHELLNLPGRAFKKHLAYSGVDENMSTKQKIFEYIYKDLI